MAYTSLESRLKNYQTLLDKVSTRLHLSKPKNLYFAELAKGLAGGQVLTILVQNGYIERHGTAKADQYTLTPKFYQLTPEILANLNATYSQEYLTRKQAKAQAEPAVTFEHPGTLPSLLLGQVCSNVEELEFNEPPVVVNENGRLSLDIEENEQTAALALALGELHEMRARIDTLLNTLTKMPVGEL